MTLAARSSTDCGIVTPICFAVLRLNEQKPELPRQLGRDGFFFIGFFLLTVAHATSLLPAVNPRTYSFTLAELGITSDRTVRSGKRLSAGSLTTSGGWRPS